MVKTAAGGREGGRLLDRDVGRMASGEARPLKEDVGSLNPPPPPGRSGRWQEPCPTCVGTREASAEVRGSWCPVASSLLSFWGPTQHLLHTRP